MPTHDSPQTGPGRVEGQPRLSTLRTTAGAALVAATVLLTAAAAPPGHAELDGVQRPELLITTERGQIVIQLLPAAAPQAVRHVIRLARGPLFDPRLIGEDGAGVGFYDGLVFDHARPHLEIRTSSRSPEKLFLVDAEMDAEALGLDQQRILSVAEAMDVLQRELLVAHGEAKRRGVTRPLLQEWVDRWHDSYSAEFLVGESRMRVNQALGYSYREGLDSRPVTAGAVMLVPHSPTRATARLAIALEDMPERTGRWMVIGRVLEGLDVVDR